jgi:hypothetical protein
MVASLTKDEKAIVIGFLFSAGVAGIGILQLQAALTATALTAYIGAMVVGAMLFNAGVSGVCALGAIWFNYRALL